MKFEKNILNLIMKKQKMNITLISVSMALIVLIIIQIYWALKLFDSERNRFENDIRDALTKVAYKLEKTEVANILIKKWDQNKMKDSFPDSHFIYNTKSQVFCINGDSLSDTIINSKCPPKIVSISVKNNSIGNEKPRLIEFYKDSLIKRKEGIIEEVINEVIIFSEQIPIEKRINRNTLDSLIKYELDRKGISSDYNFAIKNGFNKELINFNKGSDSLVLTKKYYSVPLFNERNPITTDLLLLSVPDENTYIFKSILFLLVFSLIVLIIIIYLFYKTVSMLLSQKKLTEIKNNFISNITHEFNTPISTIEIAANNLNEPEIFQNKVNFTKYINIIKNENHRIQKMVEILLNTARLENEIIFLNKILLDINLEIKTIIEKFQILIKDLAGEIILKSGQDKIFALIDRDSFFMIISNLLDNSIKYSKKSPAIIIETSQTETEISVKITDNGIGIAKSEQKRIFEMFYRVTNGNIHNTKGYGIGLSNVRKLTDAHNGKIKLNSSAGTGTTFEIILPKA